MKPTQTTRNKAFEINKSATHYGSFAEIGAGQEVARHFFQAGLASQTIAKSMSAYDKTFSDSIYGKGSRFVSEERLTKMLDHEFELLNERLKERCGNTCFFAFANTVATSSHEDVPTCHGWMGLRFQKRANGPSNDIIIHVRMLDRLRLQQQEALGVLGVNLVYAAFQHLEGQSTGTTFIQSLLDNLSRDRIEINFISFNGPDVEHIDNRLMSLELVQQGLARTVLFGPKGQPLSVADTVFRKNILIQRGRFRPVTLTNEKILEIGIKQAREDLQIDHKDLIVFMEISMNQLKESDLDQIDKKDFLDRVDTLTALGQHVLITNFTLHSELHAELRKFTDLSICTVLGASSLSSLFDPRHYENYPGGMLAAFGIHLDSKAKIYVFPYKTEKSCTTASTFHPDSQVQNIYRHFIESKKIVDMKNCEDVDTSVHSEKVRLLLAAGNPKWEDLVPKTVRELIKKKKLFGYSG